MSPIESLNQVFDRTIDSVKSVIPIDLTCEQPRIHTENLTNISLGVLIMLTGDIRGQLLIQGERSVFQQIATSMFGMELEGDMLHSFTGELGNMIAGNLSSYIAQSGINMDITPPNVIMEQQKEFQFHHRLQSPILFKENGSMQIIIELEPAS
ncbi:chemotaxis protein CheX [Sutcliffiella deserti]|uniref:chemotaxis protein CheX n=1 Tax=Sutcliffiella deserti TaxID=2875501 RepID=UPI001CBB6F6C|nr:chemotaxis protein CheX [Sutcliffiella deserti]